MNVYRHALVWLLRIGGAGCLALTVWHAVTTFQLYSRYQDGEAGMTYLLDLMAPLAASLVVGGLVALTLAEILALQIKRGPAFKDSQ